MSDIKIDSELLPLASSTKAGVIKAGSGIEITADGTANITGGTGGSGAGIPTDICHKLISKKVGNTYYLR